ncbi:hypothetical protein KL918_005187 [Ogataea parapolymorpha]|uniref:Cargo-transport protein YPP1 n=1 Tax=Ogataea parapolymorpha (strain ATCC 26012 / BCRC 20466 / JCM 22074 / NRRL Y-7560 / DL-1) TaxID=871575 RepID=W1QEZ8_OGAPD|nr:hypothetical protein HPODL_04090 [Ogataea parapolymorpha DL-1]ESW98463.1 hypothetical protein HPODL_04090 [Ogataea parapolymorpha DL-1]KAG7864866.1 hypothetical protein KL918_005187 [Ogataea parapolymorpha]KAG7873370.1 hypothetical protein KL916_002319 [Ogataea parapolymorpha]
MTVETDQYNATRRIAGAVSNQASIDQLGHEVSESSLLNDGSAGFVQLFKESSVEEIHVMAFLQMMLVSEKLDEYFRVWINHVDRYPSSTNLVAWDCLHKTLARLAAEKFANVTTKQQFDSVFAKLAGDSTLTTFGAMVQHLLAFRVLGDSNEVKSSFEHTVMSRLSKLSFPKATESNHEIDLLIDTVIFIYQYHRQDFPVDTIIEQGLRKSYQNIPLMKLWCLASIQKNDIDTLVPAYRVYLGYNHERTVQNFGGHIDIFETIDLSSSVLGYLVSTKLQRNLYDQVVVWYNDLRNMVEKDLIEMLGEGPYTVLLTRKLALIWYMLGKISQQLCHTNTVTKEILDSRLSNTLKYFEHAVQLVQSLPAHQPNDTQIGRWYFDYSFSLIKMGRLKDAIKNLKIAIKHDPDNIQYLNMITLVYSATEENLDKALKISSEVILNLKSQLAETDPAELSSSRKWDILQMFMTYITLVGADQDTFEAVECMPMFFEVVHQLFGSEISPGDSAAVEEVSEKVSENGKKNILRKIKSGRGKKPATVRVTNNLNSQETKMVHDIWLWTSKLFEKQDMVDDAEGSVAEAVSVQSETYLTHARLGQLYIGLNNKRALQELEASLDLKEDGNVEGILGFSNLVLFANDNSVFISDVDRMAAISRCKNYLESLTTNYKYFQISDIYYDLAHIYELTGDRENQERCLTKCVELADSQAVRVFDDIF